jgi:transglutaminase-like putative cysteine protease
MVFLMLLLMGIWNYGNHVARWETQRVDYSDSIRFDSTQAVLLLAGAIGILSFITPSISWREIRDYLRERERAAKSQTAETPGIPQNNTAPEKRVVPIAPLLPREHWLSGGFATSEKIVMTIKTGELPPVVIENVTTNAPRYYWRSVVYDQYVSAGWVTSPAPPQSFGPNTPLVPGVLNKYRALHLNVRMDQPEGRLFWSGLLNSADVPFTVDWRLRPQSELFPDQSALLQADMFTALSDATTYKVDSFIPTHTIEDLRSASAEYPEEIHDRYLQLPPDLPARVQELAQKITLDETNPYDKAMAIERYLRANYPYDLEIPAPPQDQDVADYFLFDLKRGYCDYYATAMVVLARSSGIPARFVSGYAPGEYDAPNAQYVVRELNAHSWVEVYFPEIGWVEFEPTAAQPEIVREESDENPIITDENKPEKPISEFLFRLINLDVLIWFSPFIVLGLLALLYYGIIERVLLLKLEPSIAMDLLYKRFYRSGRPLVGEYTQAETANEFTSKLVHKVDHVWNRFNRWPLAEQTRRNIQQLTMVYQSTLFENHIAQADDVKTALHIWNSLRIQLLAARVTNHISRTIRNVVHRTKWRDNPIDS